MLSVTLGETPTSTALGIIPLISPLFLSSFKKHFLHVLPCASHCVRSCCGSKGEGDISTQRYCVSPAEMSDAEMITLIRLNLSLDFHLFNWG